MNSELPAPLVAADVDLRGFNGFILDVDRLLASELVALGKPAECWAAVMLWCRAWKQSPPASLPDDDRILASFSGAGSNWAKVKREALRGFVKCSDGRLYHRVLSAEANDAWERRKKFRERSAKANEAKRIGGRNDRENPGSESVQQGALKESSLDATSTPTRNLQGLQQGDLQGGVQGHLNGRHKDSLEPPVEEKGREGKKEERKKDAASAAPEVPSDEADLFRRGRAVFGKEAGGLVTKLLAAKGKSIPLARAAIEQASTKSDPREYIGGILRGQEKPANPNDLWDKGL